MAKIALRAYNQEIESLIEARQIDEAIAHCRHILKTFPKHIQTYRLLGKAFLESQRYADAADILQRVLSSIPDDFIAHVGMSVIREDEGKLTEAIYHMERAFEVQPANRAIQEELRRLYGKRDGFEPPKVRLSRGALARMYAKGELYPQAIAELRAALAENPERLDLRLLLARNYLRMGQRVEAADACNLLLRKLPYCLEANQIMAEVLQNSERAADAVAYRRRVAALDPYEAHVSALIPDAGRVPDGTVTVERLAWQPGMPLVPGDYQPEWAASLGVHVPEEYPGLDEFPEWLGGSAPTEQKPALHGPALVSDDGVTPLKAEDEAAGGEIPDWMQKAGWQPGSGEETAEALDFAAETEDILAGMEELDGLPAVDLPDWVREMAPRDEKGAAQASDWVSESPLTADRGEAELGDLLEGAPAGGEPPEWLSELEEADETASSVAESAVRATDETKSLEGLTAAADVPDWLKDLAPESTSAPTEAAIPDWLSEAGPAEPPAAEAAAAVKAELPDWLQNAPGGVSEPAVEDAAAVSEPAAEAGEDLDSALAWLEGLAARQGANEALFTVPEERPEAPPDWVRQAAGEDTGEMVEAAPAEELPDWLAEAKPAVEETAAATTAPAEALPDWLEKAEAGPEGLDQAEAEPAGELPDWLVGAAAAGVAAAGARSLGEAEAAAELPDWLQEAKAADEAAGEQAAAPQGETPAWLPEVEAELSERHDADVESRLEQVEEAAEPAEEIPAWLQEMKAAEPEPAGAEAEEAAWKLETPELEAPSAGSEEAEMLPDWLKSFSAEETAGAGTGGAAAVVDEWLTEEQPEATLPVEEAAEDDWLAALETPVEEGDTKPGRTMLADHLDVGLVGEDTEQPAQEAEAILAEEMPEWLRELAPPSEVEAEAKPAAEVAEDEFTGLFAEADNLLAKTPDWSLAGEEPESVDLAEIEAEEIEANLLAEEIAPQADGEKALSELFAEAETAQVETPDWAQVTAEEAAEAVLAESGPDLSAEAEITLAGEEAALDRAALTEAEALEHGEAEVAAAEEAAAPEVEVTPPSVDIQAAAAEMPDFGDDMEAAFAWLEGLAARQGAQEALLTTPEERPEAPPDWVASAVEEIPPVETGQEATPASEAEPAEVTEEDFAALAEQPEEALPAFVEDEASAVSLEAESEPEAEAPLATVETPGQAMEVEPLDVVEAWKGVEDFIPVAEEPLEAEPEAAPELPDWLREVTQAEGPAAPEVVAESQVELKPELPAWLQEVERTAAESAAEAEAWTPPGAPEIETSRPAPVDLNKAGLSDLERLPGIGFTLAQKILDQRDQTGPFNSVMDLGRIPGVTPDMLAELEGLVTVEAAKPAATPHLRMEGPDDLLAARQSLLNGDIDGAMEQYSKLIRQRRFLPDILRDLQQAVEANPRQAEFWQVLGDAYLRDDQVQAALEAYTRVEELLR